MKRTPIRKISKEQVKRRKEWNKRVARLATERAEGYCEKCGRHYGFTGKFGLSGHHIIHRSQGGEDTDGNCEILCWRCHSKEHGINVKT